MTVFAEWDQPTAYFAAWREKAGLSVDELAHATGIPLAVLYAVESGHTFPDAWILEGLATAYQIPWRYLFSKPETIN